MSLLFFFGFVRSNKLTHSCCPLSLEDVLHLARLVGFEIERQSEIKAARYTADEEGKRSSLCASSSGRADQRPSLDRHVHVRLRLLVRVCILTSTLLTGSHTIVRFGSRGNPRPSGFVAMVPFRVSASLSACYAMLAFVDADEFSKATRRLSRARLFADSMTGARGALCPRVPRPFPRTSRRLLLEL